MTPSQDPGHVLDRLRIAPDEQSPEPDFSGLDLKDVADRLQTYTRWPLTFLTKEVLAAAGFYYTGKSDIVKCAFCQVEIGRWEPNDDPESEHRKYSTISKCLFLRWSKSTTAENCLADDRVYDTCGPYGLEGVKQAVLTHDKRTRNTMGDSYHNSTYVSVNENYFLYNERLKTFDDWSRNSGPSKEALSEAGFIYRHDEDHTSCFHCGGALRRWEETDDPWEEHAGWFPDCKFVLTMKGQKYIDAARAKRLATTHSREDNSERMVPSRQNT